MSVIFPHENVVTASGDKAKLELWLCKTLAEELDKHYPTREWVVKVDFVAGVVAVQCPEISQDHGYLLALTRSQSELLGMMSYVGGEILERAGVSRNRKHDSDDINALPRDFKDDVTLADLQSPEDIYTKSQRIIMPGDSDFHEGTGAK